MNDGLIKLGVTNFQNLCADCEIFGLSVDFTMDCWFHHIIVDFTMDCWFHHGFHQDFIRCQSDYCKCTHKLIVIKFKSILGAGLLFITFIVLPWFAVAQSFLPSMCVYYIFITHALNCIQVVYVIVKIVTPSFNRPSLVKQAPSGIVYWLVEMEIYKTFLVPNTLFPDF